MKPHKLTRRAALALVALALVAPATADARTKRFRVGPGEVKTWTSPFKIPATAELEGIAYVNGRRTDAGYQAGPQRFGMARGGVLIEVTVRKGRGPITVRMANVRDRKAKVRFVYRWSTR